MRAFLPPRHAIQAEAAIEIAVPPAQAASLYRDVERWGTTFPATIDHARIIESGENWQQLEVAHRTAGRVPNTLIFVSDTVIGLEESKPHFNAYFLNQFEPAASGTRFVITAYISLKGIYRLFGPLLRGYVRRLALRQMTNYVLVPLKQAAETTRS